MANIILSARSSEGCCPLWGRFNLFPDQSEPLSEFTVKLAWLCRRPVGTVLGTGICGGFTGIKQTLLNPQSTLESGQRSDR